MENGNSGKKYKITKNHVIIFAVIIGVVLVLATIAILALSGQKDNDDSSKAVDKKSENAITNEKNDDKIVVDNEYFQYEDYSEGLAWVKYSNAKGEFWGSIDKNGKMVFQLQANSVKEVTPFNNGYAYLIYENELKVIDKTGAILGSYVSDDNNRVVGYDSGYVFTENYKADFDSTLYTYNIYDASGTSIESFTLTDNRHVAFRSFGKGVFGYKDYSSTGWNLYFPNIKTWKQFPENKALSFYFEEDIALMHIDYAGGYDHPDGYRGKLEFIDVNGNVKEVIIPIDMGWNWSVSISGISTVDNNCVLYEIHQDRFISYNIEKNSFFKLSDEYAEKLYEEKLVDPIIFDDGYVALLLMGSDASWYVSVFDEEWNLAFEPIKVSDYDYFPLTNGRLIVKTDAGVLVYDVSGKVVFDASSAGYAKITAYSDDVARVEGQSKPTYLDLFGVLLFEEIDMSAVV